jgi:DeoR/GlpR family transcriptional regulator of sugar metabolism
MHSERLDDILKLLYAKKSVTVAELKERLGISEVTIRKDLGKLEELGLVARTWGGAVLAQDASSLRPIKLREGKARKAKLEIARAAAALVGEEDSLFLDAGTTVAAMSEAIRGRSLRILTNSLPIMIAFADEEEVSLFSLGGMFRHDARSFVGPRAVEELRRYSVDTAFMGTTGFDATGLCSAQNAFEADLKREALRIAKRRILLCDSSKFGSSAFSVFAGPGDFDLLITDSGVGPEGEVSIRELGLELLVAPPISAP